MDSDEARDARDSARRHQLAALMFAHYAGMEGRRESQMFLIRLADEFAAAVRRIDDEHEFVEGGEQLTLDQ